ncbi:unnamed protein product [Ambrosiozyma monospora]|uniref:Unnamed protein product n=1 Tax=Ambrosiozyma monospora TaxID=43982 RepID=A0ACB5T3P6_AMBMO|nr:unnamed protein product [Ambrosiozyma monospora]
MYAKMLETYEETHTAQMEDVKAENEAQLKDFKEQLENLEQETDEKLSASASQIAQLKDVIAVLTENLEKKDADLEKLNSANDDLKLKLASTEKEYAELKEKHERNTRDLRQRLENVTSKLALIGDPLKLGSQSQVSSKALQKSTSNNNFGVGFSQVLDDFDVYQDGNSSMLSSSDVEVEVEVEAPVGAKVESQSKKTASQSKNAKRSASQKAPSPVKVSTRIRRRPTRYGDDEVEAISLLSSDDEDVTRGSSNKRQPSPRRKTQPAPKKSIKKKSPAKVPKAKIKAASQIVLNDESKVSHELNFMRNNPFVEKENSVNKRGRTRSRMNEKNLPPILIDVNDKRKLSEPVLSDSVAKLKQPSGTVTKAKQSVPANETRQQSVPAKEMEQQSVPAPAFSSQTLAPEGLVSKKRSNNTVKTKTHKRRRLRKNIVEEDLEFSE